MGKPVITVGPRDRRSPCGAASLANEPGHLAAGRNDSETACVEVQVEHAIYVELQVEVTHGVRGLLFAPDSRVLDEARDSQQSEHDAFTTLRLETATQ